MVNTAPGFPGRGARIAVIGRGLEDLPAVTVTNAAPASPHRAAAAAMAACTAKDRR